jgi:hypothetical protein
METWQALCVCPSLRNPAQTHVLFVDADIEFAPEMLERFAASGHDVVTGRGLHSSTFRLNASTFCGIRWVHDFPPVY